MTLKFLVSWRKFFTIRKVFCDAGGASEYICVCGTADYGTNAELTDVAENLRGGCKSTVLTDSLLRDGGVVGDCEYIEVHSTGLVCGVSSRYRFIGECKVSNAGGNFVR